jgi:hypothetical protein
MSAVVRDAAAARWIDRFFHPGPPAIARRGASGVVARRRLYASIRARRFLRGSTFPTNSR